MKITPPPPKRTHTRSSLRDRTVGSMVTSFVETMSASTAFSWILLKYYSGTDLRRRDTTRQHDLHKERLLEVKPDTADTIWNTNKWNEHVIIWQLDLQRNCAWLLNTQHIKKVYGDPIFLTAKLHDNLRTWTVFSYWHNYQLQWPKQGQGSRLLGIPPLASRALVTGFPSDISYSASYWGWPFVKLTTT